VLGQPVDGEPPKSRHQWSEEVSGMASTVSGAPRSLARARARGIVREVVRPN